MKFAPFLLLFLYLQDVTPEDIPALAKEIYQNKSPRKAFQILLLRRDLKGEKLKTLKTKKPLSPINKGYTFFPPVGKAGEKFFNIPDSPMFPASAQTLKTRVKKVLPDYADNGARRKRSASEVTRSGRKKNKTSSKKSGSKKSKRSKSRSKSKRLRHQKHFLRSGNGTGETEKPLRYTPRDKHGNKTKEAKRSGRKHKGRKDHKKGRGRKGDEKRGDALRVLKRTKRLIAAKDALIEDYPYVVSIQKNGEHWCGGAILNPRLVITTANCVWKSERVSMMRIRAGSRFTDEGGQRAKIQEVRRHPLWNIRTNPDNDVALLLLDHNLKFSDSLHAVDLPNRVMLPPFLDVWVTSWGADRRDGIYDKTSMTLQSMHQRLMDPAKCNNVTMRFGVPVTENFICLSQVGGRAPCTRDTGSPAVSDGVLWGMASWGIRKLCGTQRYPAMFSYLASQSNMDFITNATHTMMADERFYPFPDRLYAYREQKK